MDSLPNKKFYTLLDLAQYFNVSEEYMEKFVKDGTIHTITNDKHQLVSKAEFEKNTKEYLEHILRSSMDRKYEVKQSMIDKVRSGLVEFIVTIIVPVITLIVYNNIVGYDYYSTEVGGLIGIGLAIISGFIAYIGYNVIFPKYSGNLPEKFF